MPAALYKAMGGFATNGVNMTKLESYQLGGKFFATLFYADVEGHPDDHNLKLALEELEFFSAEFRIVGVYPASPFRANIAEPEENRDNRPHAGAWSWPWTPQACAQPQVAAACRCAACWPARLRIAPGARSRRRRAPATSRAWPAAARLSSELREVAGAVDDLAADHGEVAR